jgi:hypothetical protein
MDDDKAFILKLIRHLKMGLDSIERIDHEGVQADLWSAYATIEDLIQDVTFTYNEVEQIYNDYE